jgi:hypothetical protein
VSTSSTTVFTSPRSKYRFTANTRNGRPDMSGRIDRVTRPAICRVNSAVADGHGNLDLRSLPETNLDLPTTLVNASADTALRSPATP